MTVQTIPSTNTPKGWDSTAVLVDNILSYYDSSTEGQREAGAAWYPQAHKVASVISEATGVDVHRIVLAISALSPRNPWRWNIFDAYSFAVARINGRTMPSATTFKRNQLAAWRALDPSTDIVWYTSAPKVRAFVAAILGDVESVVVDTWAVRVATGGSKSRVANDAEYAHVAHAYNVAANLRGVEPRAMQAITWLVAQTEGLASQRRGRHDLSFKAGTPDWLKEAIA